MHNHYTLKPGIFVVLEGPDGTGKSTQCGRLASILSAHPAPLVTSQPRGDTELGREISRITNAQHALLDPLALQLLHLASHAHQYQEEIFPALAKGGVILDRCWWSTIVYGYFGSDINAFMTFPEFEKLVLLPTHNRSPDLVFLFLHSWTVATNPKVQKGYSHLAERYKGGTVVVPALSLEETTDFLIDNMFDRGFLEKVS